MYWPATTAVASGTAGLETESVPGVSGPGRVIVPVTRTRSVLPCTEDPDLFFAESPQDVETAKAMCHECPVRIACLTGALERQEPWGVWGGELFLRGGAPQEAARAPTQDGSRGLGPGLPASRTMKGGETTCTPTSISRRCGSRTC
jgi:WhiB family transcriptional regulator, redox-sensing transcriptional regulator